MGLTRQAVVPVLEGTVRSCMPEGIATESASDSCIMGQVRPKVVVLSGQGSMASCTPEEMAKESASDACGM